MAKICVHPCSLHTNAFQVAGNGSNLDGQSTAVWES